MGKKLPIVFMFILAVTSGILFLASRTPDEPSTSQPAINTAEPDQTANSGSYVDYSAQALTTASGERVLFFHAPWCPQCRSIEAGIKEQGVPSGVSILKVDYDSNQPLRQKYGVTIQTTFVKVDEAGNLIDKYVAYDKPTFDAVKQNFL